MYNAVTGETTVPGDKMPKRRKVRSMFGSARGKGVGEGEREGWEARGESVGGIEEGEGRAREKMNNG